MQESLYHALRLGSGLEERGAGVETQKNVRGEVEGWGRVPFNEPYAPSLSTIYDWGVGLIKFLKMVLDPSPPPLVSSCTCVSDCMYACTCVIV